MPQVSSVERLPDKIREEINRLIRKRATIDEIIEHLRSMDVPTSRSAVGRYKKKLKDISDRIRHSREIANALVENFGERPENNQAEFNIELLHGILSSVALAADDGESVTLKPVDAMNLAKAADHLAKARKNDTETLRKNRDDALKDAVKAVTTTAKKRGLSKEAVDEINASIMGIAKK